MSAATTDTAATRTGSGVARSLLAIHLLCRASHLGAALRAMRSLARVGLVHHDRVVEELFVDPRRECVDIQLVRADRGAAAVVDG